MRQLLFALTLAVYGFSAMDLHEWVHVPQVVAHLLEHHSDLGHHDEDTGTHHDPAGHQDPFSKDCHGEFCACGGFAAIVPGPVGQLVTLAPLATPMGGLLLTSAPSAFTGNVWNPPKA